MRECQVFSAILKSIFAVSVLAVALIVCGKDVPARPRAIGIVNVEKLNVRSGAGVEHKSICLIDKGQTVGIIASEGKWLRIILPENAEIWISSAMLEENLVPKKNAFLRSGPSVAYEIIGEAAFDTPVVIKEKSDDGLWMKIQPQGDLEAFVSAAYVNISESEAEKLKKGQPDKAKPQSEDEKIEVLAKSAAESPFIAHDEKSISLDGLVMPLKKDSQLATHALVIEISGEYYPVAYLSGSGMNLNLWEKRKVRVSGTQHWVEGWTRPMLDVEKIVPLLQ